MTDPEHEMTMFPRVSSDPRITKADVLDLIQLLVEDGHIDADLVMRHFNKYFPEPNMKGSAL